MSGQKDFTLQDVAAHNTKKDIYVVIHEKVHDVSAFVDEHPGGEEVLLDVAGQDATEAFEDVGHSDEAREILEGLMIGNLKRQPGDPAPKVTSSPTTTAVTSSEDKTSLGIGLPAVVILGAAIALGVYQYLQTATPKTQA